MSAVADRPLAASAPSALQQAAQFLDTAYSSLDGPTLTPHERHIAAALHTALRDAFPFYAWLIELHPATVVGNPANVGSCPLARFLAEQVGVGVQIGPIIAMAGSVLYMGTPPWASAFMRAVDGHQGSITAGLALSFLRQTQRESAWR